MTSVLGACLSRPEDPLGSNVVTQLQAGYLQNRPVEVSGHYQNRFSSLKAMLDSGAPL